VICKEKQIEPNHSGGL